MKRIYIILMINFLIINYLTAQHWEWAKNTCLIDYSGHSYIKTDSKDNIYVLYTGNYVTPVNRKDPYPGGGMMMLVKYDNKGNYLWDKKLLSGEYTESNITIDRNDNVYITGGFTGDLDFGNIKLPGTTYFPDAFLVKFNSNGECQWAKRSVNPNGGASYSVVCDIQCNVYITGQFAKTCKFDSTTINGTMFLCKYDSTGNLTWAKGYGGYQNSVLYSNAMSLDSAGNIYITGYFNNTAKIGNIFLTSRGDRDAFIAKFNNYGNVIWTKDIGSAGYDEGKEILTDNQNNIYSIGYTCGLSYFDNKISNDSGNIYITKFDNNGENLWIKRGYWQGWSHLSLLLKNNYIYTHGIPTTFSLIKYYNDTTIITESNEGNFILKIDSLGNLNSILNIGNKNTDYVYTDSFSFNSNNNLIINGNFYDTLKLGQLSLIKKISDTLEYFLAKLNMQNCSLQVDAGKDFKICSGDNTILRLNNDISDGNLRWSTGDTTASVTVKPEKTTTYEVSVSAGGCTASTQVLVKVDSCTGINELKVESEKIKVYPNPGSGEFVVEVEVEGMKDEMIDLRVMDVMGKVVESEKIKVKSDGMIKFDLSGFESGVYFINLTPNSSPKGDGSLQRIVKKVVLMK